MRKIGLSAGATSGTVPRTLSRLRISVTGGVVAIMLSHLPGCSPQRDAARQNGLRQASGQFEPAEAVIARTVNDAQPPQQLGKADQARWWVAHNRAQRQRNEELKKAQLQILEAQMQELQWRRDRSASQNSFDAAKADTNAGVETASFPIDSYTATLDRIEMEYLMALAAANDAPLQDPQASAGWDRRAHEVVGGFRDKTKSSEEAVKELLRSRGIPFSSAPPEIQELMPCLSSYTTVGQLLIEGLMAPSHRIRRSLLLRADRTQEEAEDSRRRFEGRVRDLRAR